MSFNQIKVELLSHWGGDRDAANAAWVSSTDKARLDTKTDDDVRKLISNLVTLGHDTPKERIWMEFFITCPIFVERELDKYRLTQQYQDFQISCNVANFGRYGATQNELSARYRTLPERYYYIPSDVTTIVAPIDLANYNLVMQEQYKLYNSMLIQLKQRQDKGEITNAQYKRAREVLRGMLGTGYLTDMRMVLNMNAFEHIMNQRLNESAQPETQFVALLMLTEARKIESTMIEKMIDVNGWQKHINRIEKYF